ncbi:ATP-depentend DNA helicase, putative [Penicillium digitatum]|uniref:DNA 3'-5' helicase n=3 Tax=Penicillium digitatum TaxID=36651 RepID=K9FML6_PEND2|nr:ATP-depentend DNA helicase, putative [Penicillium digitatum Pd1]EKV07856.1 ATP-depentend DNA helicase, putative [Penicillium digitatum Pd1]EKV09587.1 ATP-depentend DNA helicase, putative [Penicillium digitatum PHI26]QQK41445.1 ATP-depentend DNA helicase, putative [Penicillium digitatum]
MDPILDGLNHAQREAVTSSGSILQVLAPPGSGKTKTLTARVAYLLSHHGYQPHDVICCTFTIKASREMRERLAKLIGEKLESRLILGTFHSICRRYLVKYGYLIGLRKGFGIADSDDTRAILRRTIKRLKSSIEVKAAQGRISRHKAHGLGPDALADRAKAEEIELVEIYRAYESALAASNLLDYDDLLLRCGDLLRDHPQCVSNVQAVLVDEFQDTNVIQYELMNLFASKNRRITVVGDPDQSIYGFRSAEIQNLKRMQRRYSNTTVVLLEDNYRSAGSILNAAQEVIEQDTSRPAKALLATHSFGTLPVLRRLPTPSAEAQWMVLEIKRCAAMTGGLLRMSDFAVLLRSASLSTQIETAFGRAGIPYKMVGGRKFFDRTEVKILLNYMRVVGHTGHSDALINIVNVPPRRIGDETIKQLTSGAEKAKIPLWDYIKDVIQGRRSTEKKLQKAAEQGLCFLVKLIEASRQKLQECEDASAPRVLIEFIAERLSFQEYLIRTYPLDEDSRWANVKELMHQANEVAAFEGEEVDKEMDLPEIEGVQQQHAHPGEEALTRFLANVALATEITTKEETKDGDQPSEKVTISTIHAAKGLEWPVVFVPAVYNGSIPHSRAEVVEEERRLLYVAMTRAQALLYLSVPIRQPRLGEGEDSATTVTPFLPPKLTKTRFRPTGPSLHEKVVYAIADILRRPRPSLDDIYQGLEFLPSTLDDRWTAEGEEDRSTFDDTTNSHDTSGEPNPKRRRSDMNQGPKPTTYISSTGYTMNNSTGFTIPTTVSSGFTSARDYIAAKPEPSAESASKPPAHAEADAAGASKVKPLSSASRKDGLTQASISNFFAGPGSQKREPVQSSYPQPPPSHRYEGLPSQHQRSGASIVPSTLSSHRVQPRPLVPTRPTLDPTNLNGYTWLAAPSKPTLKPTRIPMTQEQSGNATSLGGTAGPDEVKPGRSTRGFQPVSTFHNTTMSMVQQAPRRTLGIRRSMNGWQDRMKRQGGGQAS